jgi:hypothetical protein
MKCEENMGTPTLNYRTPIQVGRIIPQPKLWVLLVIFLLWFVGAICGEWIWPFLHQPGKDPQREMSAGLMLGLFAGGVLCAVFRKRLWRLRAAYVLAAFGLGMVSTSAGIAWALLHQGWHYIP